MVWAPVEAGARGENKMLHGDVWLPDFHGKLLLPKLWSCGLSSKPTEY